MGALSAHAQTAPSAQVDGSDSQPTLEAVAVTAQRRKQSVQDIPYNISAVDAAGELRRLFDQ
jgi:outer membrane receptor protein involved in Fe transport